MPLPRESGDELITEDALDVIVTEDDEPLATEDSEDAQGGFLYRLHRALGRSEQRAYNDAVAVLNSCLPDNEGFTIDDAHDWYRRLGIYDSGSVPLEDMKAAIRRKLAHPRNTKPRQNYRYIEQELQDAGFDVYVYENRFYEGSPLEWVTHTPQDIVGEQFMLAQVGNPQAGDTQVGTEAVDCDVTVIANHVDDEKDFGFVIGDNYRSTFFIAGPTIDSFADVLEARHIEFRELILRLKPAQTVGFLFINYTT
jgi:hypothetical protein